MHHLIKKMLSWKLITIRSQIEDMQKQISENSEKEKILEKKVYFDGTGSDEDMAKVEKLVNSKEEIPRRLGMTL